MTSITDELRGLAADPLLGYASQKVHAEAITAIADRIDAAHEEALVSSYLAGVFSDEELAENGIVRLHEGADGEYIREHDKVDWRDHAGTWHENATVVALCNDGCYVMDGTIFHVHKSDIRHHHAPTVEDLLHEFVGKALCVSDVVGEDELVTEYAAKLREVLGE